MLMINSFWEPLTKRQSSSLRSITFTVFFQHFSLESNKWYHIEKKRTMNNFCLVSNWTVAVFFNKFHFLSQLNENMIKICKENTTIKTYTNIIKKNKVFGSLVKFTKTKLRVFLIKPTICSSTDYCYKLTSHNFACPTRWIVLEEMKNIKRIKRYNNVRKWRRVYKIGR